MNTVSLFCVTALQPAVSIDRPRRSRTLSANGLQCPCRLEQVQAVLAIVFLFVAGFVCVDKSPNSSNKVKLKRGVQDGKGKTAESWGYVYAYISWALPFVVILENLNQLFEAADVDSMNDGDFIIAELKRIRYVVVSWILTDAKKHRSLATRFRVFFLAIRMLLAIRDGASSSTGSNTDALEQQSQDIVAFIHDVFNSMNAYPTDPESFLMAE